MSWIIVDQTDVFIFMDRILLKSIVKIIIKLIQRAVSIEKKMTKIFSLQGTFRQTKTLCEMSKKTNDKGTERLFEEASVFFIEKQNVIFRN